MTKEDIVRMYAVLKGENRRDETDKKVVEASNDKIREMIKENERLIEEGNDPEGRRRLINVLQEQIKDPTYKFE